MTDRQKGLDITHNSQLPVMEQVTVHVSSLQPEGNPFIKTYFWSKYRCQSIFFLRYPEVSLSLPFFLSVFSHSLCRFFFLCELINLVAL